MRCGQGKAIFRSSVRQPQSQIVIAQREVLMAEPDSPWRARSPVGPPGLCPMHEIALGSTLSDARLTVSNALEINVVREVPRRRSEWLRVGTGATQQVVETT
jgi:hypothetical protein